jgi:hypothetical protein
MSERQQIIEILKRLEPIEAIKLIESIGKQLRQWNSIRITNNNKVPLIEMERPDLIK